MSARRQESLVRAPKSPVKLGYFCGKPYQDEVPLLRFNYVVGLSHPGGTSQ